MLGVGGTLHECTLAGLDHLGSRVLLLRYLTGVNAVVSVAVVTVVSTLSLLARAPSRLAGTVHPRFRALLSVLIRGSLQAKLVLIRIVKLPFQGAAAVILLLLADDVRLDTVRPMLIALGWLS